MITFSPATYFQNIETMQRNSENNDYQKNIQESKKQSIIITKVPNNNIKISNPYPLSSPLVWFFIISVIMMILIGCYLSNKNKEDQPWFHGHLGD